MSEKTDYIFKCAEIAKISMTDLARITGVSRETLYRWKKGRPINDHLRLNIVYQYALRMEKACRIGELPLSNKYKKEQRLKVLRKIVADMASK